MDGTNMYKKHLEGYTVGEIITLATQIDGIWEKDEESVGTLGELRHQLASVLNDLMDYGFTNLGHEHRIIHNADLPDYSHDCLLNALHVGDEAQLNEWPLKHLDIAAARQKFINTMHEITFYGELYYVERLGEIK